MRSLVQGQRGEYLHLHTIANKCLSMFAAEVQDSNGEVLVNFVTLLKIKGKLLRFFIPEGGKFLNIV